MLRILRQRRAPRIKTNVVNAASTTMETGSKTERIESRSIAFILLPCKALPRATVVWRLRPQDHLLLSLIDAQPQKRMGV